jgi:uncharacterized protein YbaR (Trm112 family)
MSRYRDKSGFVGCASRIMLPLKKRGWKYKSEKQKSGIRAYMEKRKKIKGDLGALYCRECRVAFSIIGRDGKWLIYQCPGCKDEYRYCEN